MSENATDCLIKEAGWQLEKFDSVSHSIANELISCTRNQQDRIRRLEDYIRRYRYNPSLPDRDLENARQKFIDKLLEESK